MADFFNPFTQVVSWYTNIKPRFLRLGKIHVYSGKIWDIMADFSILSRRLFPGILV